MFHQQIKNHKNPIIKIQSEKDSPIITIYDDQGVITTFDESKNQIISSKKINFQKPISFIKIKKNYIYFGQENGDIIILKKENKEIFAKVMGHQNSISNITIINSSIFLSSCLDGKLLIWDKINMDILKVFTFEEYISYIKKIDEEKIYLLIGENKLVIFDFDKGKVEREFSLGLFGITFLKIEDNKAYFGDIYGKLNIIKNLDNFFLKKENIKRLIGHDSWINNIIFYKEFLITFGDDAKIKFWNYENLKVLDVINKGHRKSISASNFKNDVVISGCLDGLVYLWKIEDVRKRIKEKKNLKLKMEMRTQELLELENKKKKKKLKKKKK